MVDATVVIQQLRQRVEVRVNQQYTLFKINTTVNQIIHTAVRAIVHTTRAQ